MNYAALNPYGGFNPYPLEAFPSAARKAVEELAMQVQAPLPLIATSCLAAMSAAAQERVKVKLPYGGDPKPVTLFVFVVADSGERKTPIDDRFLEPIKRRDQRRRSRETEEECLFKVRHKLWKGEESALIKKISEIAVQNENYRELEEKLLQHSRKEPSKPRPNTQLRQDLSPRAILEDLDGEKRSIAIVSEEGQIVLQSPLFASSGFLNKAWDGGSIMLNRGNGLRIFAEDSRLTISIMAQRSVIQDYLDGGGQSARGTGFLPRFLFTVPPTTKGTRFKTGINASWKHLMEFHELMDVVMGEDGASGQGPEQQVLELDDDAKEYLIELINQTEVMIQQGGSMHAISDFASKACEIMVRIAALFHTFSSQEGKISRDTLDRAVKVVNYHVEEFGRIFATSFSMPGSYEDSARLEDYLRSVMHSNQNMPIPRNDALRYGPVRPKSRFDPALSLLQAAGKFRVDKDDKRRSWIHLGPYGFQR